MRSVGHMLRITDYCHNGIEVAIVKKETEVGSIIFETIICVNKKRKNVQKKDT